MDLMILNHVTYLCLAAAITVVTGNVLHKHGRPFLVDVFRGDGRLADAVNHLLLVGFYLMNLGIAAWGVKCGGNATTVRESLELNTHRIGVMLLILGVMHCINVVVLCSIRRRKLAEPLDVVEYFDD